MNAAKFPIHRDLAGFDFDSAKADQSLVRQLATLSFTDTAENAVFIGGPGTGKTHLATAIAVAGIVAGQAGTLSTPRSIWLTFWSGRSAMAAPGGLR